MVKKSIVFAAIVIVIIVIAGVLGWYFITLPRPPVTPIKIGFFAPLTGPAAADGYSALHGALLAVSHINDKGGVLGRRVDLIYYDDALKADQAIAVVTKLIEQDRVVAIVSGSYSGPTLAVAPLIEERKLPMVSAYAVHPMITKNKTWIYRVGMLGENEGLAAGYAAVKFFNAKKIAILFVNIPFGITLAENSKKQAEKMGAEVVFYDKFDIGEKDFRPWLTRIATIKDLDVLMIFGYYYHASALVQARELGIKAQIIGAEGFDSPKFIELAGEAAEGVVIVTDLDRDSPREVVKRFLMEYHARTGIPADMVGASAYDAVMLVATAIERAGSTEPLAIKKALSETKDFDGAAGVILQFTPGNNSIKAFTLQIVKEKKFRFYKEIKEPDIITPSF